MSSTGTEHTQSGIAESMDAARYQEPSADTPETKDTSTVLNSDVVDAHASAVRISGGPTSLTVNVDVRFLAQRDRIRRINKSLGYQGH